MNIVNSLSNAATNTLQAEHSNWFRNICDAIRMPAWLDITLNRLRMTTLLESGTVTTCSTVTSVTNVVSVGTYPAQQATFEGNNAAWALTCRARIT